MIEIHVVGSERKVVVSSGSSAHRGVSVVVVDEIGRLLHDFFIDGFHFPDFLRVLVVVAS